MVTELYKHWDLHLDKDNVLWLGFDRSDKSVNSLSRESIQELDNIVDGLNSNKLNNINVNNTVGVVIYSKKSTGFIAGADVSEFTKIENVNDAQVILEHGQNTLTKLSKLKLSTVAMIDGFCLGGGCELALACKYRVASKDNLSTKIGLPEVMLGIIPGWGGTVRLVDLIGPIQAIPLMLQGRTVSASNAARIGLVDAAVPKRQLKRTAKYFAVHRPSKDKKSFLITTVELIRDSLFSVSAIRKLFGSYVRKQLASKAKEQHYPAPYKIIENWEKNGVNNLSKSLKAEIDADLELVQHSTAKNLIRVFFLQEKLKELGKGSDFAPKHVHVIGAGTMGGDIAAWCAFKGFHVTLQDKSEELIGSAIGRAAKLFKKKLKKDYLIMHAQDKLIPDVNGYGIKSADIIIEAVFEDLAVKQEIFSRCEKESKPTAILATNTSSIPLDEINTVLIKPERLVGIHFFNPVAQMMLVEVVKGEKTANDVLSNANVFVGKIGKLPVPVASKPGFLVNRVLAAYMQETFILLEEGKTPHQIDSAMKDFGMPMGPVEMADIVGLDVCLSVAKNIASSLQTEGVTSQIPEILTKKINEKELGKKTGKGFYDYKNGKKVNANNNSSLSKGEKEQITDRLTMQILNTCVNCLNEKIVNDEWLIDAGLIFGAGFAPFRGGPMNFLHTLGKDNVLNKMATLQSTHGNRFKPDEGFKLLKSDSNGSMAFSKSSLEKNHNSEQNLHNSHNSSSDVKKASGE